jgi:hypothetical protein
MILFLIRIMFCVTIYKTFKKNILRTLFFGFFIFLIYYYLIKVMFINLIVSLILIFKCKKRN